MERRRNPNIELWRCFCMFAVVCGHVLVNNGIIPTMNAFLWHIPGFLLITGYFGIGFTFAKVLKLIGITYGCYWLTIPFRLGEETVLSLLLPHGGWFLPFYLVLMAVSIVFEAALNDSRNTRKIAIVIIALLLLGWIPTLSANRHLAMLRIPGFQGSGLLLMAGTYFIGRAMKRGLAFERLPCLVWIVLFISGIMVMDSHLGGKHVSNGYASPFAIMVAVCGFSAFLRLPQLSDEIGKAVNFISPSMFGVYILHECCLKKYQYAAAEFDGGGVIISVALFFACVAIDLLRRLIVCAVFTQVRNRLPSFQK